jgi:hypothetical protein
VLHTSEEFVILWNCSPFQVKQIKSLIKNVLLCVRGSVANNNWFWIGWFDLLALLLQLQSIITAHNQWLTNTRSILYWTANVFSSTMNGLVLIYESVTSSASVARWLTLHNWTLNYWILCSLTNEWITESYIKTVGQSARPPLWSSGQSTWLQIQRSRVRFPALPNFPWSSGSGTGSTQLRSYLGEIVAAPV